MPTLKPIKVTLVPRTHANGNESVWPDFRSLYDTNPAAFNNKLPSVFFDQDGLGWHMNKVANLGTGATNGEAYTAVPAANADLILAAAIEGVSAVVDEAEFESFYDNKSHAHEPDFNEDERVLQSIAAKKQLGMKERASDRAALDPDDPRPGIRRNLNKTWQGYKAARNITLDFT